MKPYKIALFIISVIAILAFACWLFPVEGIHIGSIELRFATLTDVLTPAKHGKTATAEELLADNSMEIEEISPDQIYAETQREAMEQQYLDFITKNPARIYLPDSNIEFFNVLFEALQNANQEPMRVLHYGDSQIEIDRITGYLRESLQARFGGQGAGLCPLIQTVPTTTVSQTCNVSLPRYMPYGPAEFRAKHSKYGIMAQSTRLTGTAHCSFGSRDWKDVGIHARTFNRLSVMFDDIDSTLTITVTANNETQNRTISAHDSIYQVDFNLPNGTSRTSLSLSGNALIYGVSMQGEQGVTVDNIPMRGCSGTIFSSINSAQPRAFCAQNNVRLIIMQYGGNSMGYLNSEKSRTTYFESIGKQIDLMHAWAPNATILFIGPSDMATSIRGVRQTYPQLPSVVDGLRTTVLEHGAAFWDLFASMGGEGSMVQWVEAGLAASDYVHFAPAGANKMAKLLVQALFTYYGYFQLKNGVALSPLKLKPIDYTINLVDSMQPVNYYPYQFTVE